MKRSQDARVRIQMLVSPHAFEAGLLGCESPTWTRGNVASFQVRVTDGSSTQLLPPRGDTNSGCITVLAKKNGREFKKFSMQSRTG